MRHDADDLWRAHWDHGGIELCWQPGRGLAWLRRVGDASPEALILAREIDLADPRGRVRFATEAAETRNGRTAAWQGPAATLLLDALVAAASVPETDVGRPAAPLGRSLTDAPDVLPGRFVRTDLAAVTAITPPLVLGVAYRGFQTSIVGPTGSAKTLLLQGLLLEAAHAGVKVGHWDNEMGASPIAFRYRAMGATDAELAKIAYYAWPEPTLTDSDAFAEQVAADGSEIVGIDPTADFLSAAGLDEDVNNEVTRWAAAFPQRLTQAGVTTITVDGMPHDRTRQRGASQKGYKAALVWTVEVLDEPSKDHVGLVQLSCVKDRFGEVGKGATLAFAVGGDGAGRIVVARKEAMARPSAIEQHDADESRWVGVVVATLQQHAPDEAHAISQTQLLGLLPTGKNAAFRREACRRAASHPLIQVRAKPGNRGSVLYWYDSTVSDRDGQGPTHRDRDKGGDTDSTGVHPVRV